MLRVIMNPQEVIEQAQSRREQVLGYLADLVAARTENPPGDECRAAAVLERFFGDLGVVYEKHEQETGRSNIVGRLGRGRPRVAVVCHLDTVPAGDGWTTDPFRAVVKENRVFGRGTKDDKGPLASAMAAIAYLKEHESDLAGEVLLVGAADEECGSRLGTEFLLETGALGEVDAAIIPDAGNNLETIDVAEKGLLFLKITCHGRQAHGSTPEVGASAIYPMAELALWFRKWRMPGGENRLFEPQTPTRNVGTLRGGSAPNMVPATCEMQVDMRYLPGTEQEELLAPISNVIDRLEAKYPGTCFEIEHVVEGVPTAVEPESPVCRALASAVETVTGRRPKPFGMGGATVAKQFVAAGVPAVGICPGDPGTEHVADEYVPVAELVDFSAVLTLCLWQMIGRT